MKSKELAKKPDLEFEEISKIFSDETLSEMNMLEIYGGEEAVKDSLCPPVPTNNDCDCGAKIFCGHDSDAYFWFFCTGGDSAQDTSCTVAKDSTCPK
jgi:hypothetical protein